MTVTARAGAQKPLQLGWPAIPRNAERRDHRSIRRIEPRRRKASACG